MSTLANIGMLLSDVFFGLVILLLLFRLLLAIGRADFYNPLSQTVVKLTDPLVLPLRRLIPPIGRVDTAIIVLLVVLQVVHFLVKTYLVGVSIPLPRLLLISIIEVADKVLLIYFAAIIIQVIFSWLTMAGVYLPAPIASLLGALTSPIMDPIRRVMPNTGMIDFSPLIALLLLQIGRIVLAGIP